MSTHPQQSGDAKPKATKLSLQDRLDELLLEIEAVEPGTLDPAVLPEQSQSVGVEATPSAEAEIDALLNAPPMQTAASAAVQAEQAVEAAPAAPEPAADATTPEQADMLAALNSALQGLGDEPSADTAAPADEAASPAASPSDEAMSMEDKLQAEIAALMNAEPQVDETPATNAAVQAATTEAYDEFDGLEGSFESPESLSLTSEAVQPTTAPTSTTEDLIAQEIEGLLNTGQDEPATAASADTAIDELDKMLAQEIDADDDLAGDFQSVEDLTAGIQVPDAVASTTDDEHAATARDVAAELDSQPEDLPAASFEPITTPDSSDKDPFAEQNDQRVARQAPDWAHWLDVGREKLLSACYLINWPARRFLSNEWRATLGLISLTFAFTSSIFLFVVLVFG